MMNNGALSGIRVIDLTRILAGPICTMNLGDMGAEIIKVENPEGGDDTRGWGPPFVKGEAAYFLGVNRNKRSITLNVKEKEGKEILRSLLKNADILIENFKVGTLEKWGFSQEWFDKNVPQLIHCSITGYGEKGPKGGMPGYDFLLQAESGLMSITGEKEGRPAKLGVAIVDVCTGQYAAMTILAALNARNNTKQGQRIDLSLFNSSLSMLINVASNYLIGNQKPDRYGNGHPNIVPYSDFKCSDGYIAIAVGNDNQFKRLAKCLDAPQLAEINQFETNAQRVMNRIDLEKKMNEILARRTVKDWISLFDKNSIPCSKINSVSEALESEQTKNNEMVLQQKHPTAGTYRTLGIPFKFSKTPAEINIPPPLLGADTDDILMNLLNLKPEKITQLRKDRVI